MAEDGKDPFFETACSHFESAQKQLKKAIDAFKKREKRRLKEGDTIIRHHLVGDYDSHWKAWCERFVKGGIKRGHFWIWWNNREIRNDKNFVEVKNHVNPDGRVGFDIHSDNIELKWHWKSLKNPIKFHKESLEEWLVKRMVHHCEKIMEEVGGETIKAPSKN